MVPFNILRAHWGFSTEGTVKGDAMIKNQSNIPWPKNEALFVIWSVTMGARHHERALEYRDDQNLLIEWSKHVNGLFEFEPWSGL